ncbi:MAG: hypothetical protein JOY83_24295 [Alphaproteobacteria bacterium]|nr:hypothetical protein [Alphaproteobacteria bacterium]
MRSAAAAANYSRFASINAIFRKPKPSGGHSIASGRVSNASVAVRAGAAGEPRVAAAASAGEKVAAGPMHRRLDKPRRRRQPPITSGVQPWSSSVGIKVSRTTILSAAACVAKFPPSQLYNSIFTATGR